MPILIKDHTWRQTEDLILVRVPLRNVSPAKVDLFTSEIYIKVHYPPFLFESCLWERINEEESRCTLGEGEAVFSLVKGLPGVTWPSLDKELTSAQAMEVKRKALDEARARAENETKLRKESRARRQKACVSEQIALQGAVHQKINHLKEIAKTSAVTEIQEWKKHEDKNFLPDPIRKAYTKLQAGKGGEEREYSSSIPSTPVFEEIFTETEVRRDRGQEEVGGGGWRVAEVLTPARGGGTIGVSFTPRAFPTPSRESKLGEENEWLKKMAEAKRRTGFVAEDLRPEENDPQWLLDKGRSFHGLGNYLGAVSAFSHALNTWKKIPELWLARAESQLALGNYRRVLRDTTEAVELLKPHVPANAGLRYTCHLNRGKALLELGQPRPALADLEEALSLQPYSQLVHTLICRAEGDIEKMAEEEAKLALHDKSSTETTYIESEDLAN